MTHDAIDAALQARDEAVDFVFDALAKALGLDHWVQEDGSETWEGDVRATLYQILRDSGAIDPETNEPALIRAARETEALKEALAHANRQAEEGNALVNGIVDLLGAPPDSVRSPEAFISWVREQIAASVAAYNRLSAERDATSVARDKAIQELADQSFRLGKCESLCDAFAATASHASRRRGF